MGDLNLPMRFEHPYHDWMSRNPLLMERCRDCEFLPACAGGCAGISYDRHGTYHKEDCREKHLALERIKYYLEEKTAADIPADL